MPAQFGRVAILQMGTVLVQGLRTKFHLEYTNDEAPNAGEVTVWNLSATTRAKIDAVAESTGSIPLVLQGGYQGMVPMPTLFNGDILKNGMSTVRNGPNWLTTFKVGDGLASYRRDRVSLSFPPGASIQQVVQGIMGFFVSGVNTATALATIVPQLTGKLQTFVNGTVVHGGVLQELNKILRAHGLIATSQKGTLDIAPIGGFVPSVAPLLTPQTGLIGNPEPAKDHFVRFKCLLRSEILPARQVIVQAGFPLTTTVITAKKVAHDGDTRDQDWYTEVEGTAA